MDLRRNIDISRNRVVNVADPTADHHGATKNYVALVHVMDNGEGGCGEQWDGGF